MALLRRDPGAREVKGERMARILEAARDCLARLPATRVTLQAVARRAGVGEGLPSMYFGSLEALVGKVTAAELDAWAETTAAELAAGGSLPASAGVERVAELLAGRPLLARTLAVAPLLLEAGTEPEPAEALLAARRTAATTVAQALAAACSEIDEAGGATLLDRLLTLAAGLEPLTRPVGGLALATDHSKADPAAELRTFASCLFSEM